ncbi:VWA domain-containing protein [Amycolatopsis sp. NPDC021455]|uniref:VWA domain-containing protein n=1 Tax=Amycolatopsis sp. NPDC021455 TaxID=3154901 RepID=UPI00340B86F6
MTSRAGKARTGARLWTLGATVLLLLSMNAPFGAAQDAPAPLPALQVAVLVDESGSLSTDDVAEEKKAARSIAFSVLAPGSIVSVVGFGSSNGPGQSPVDVVCSRISVDEPQKRDSLAKCIGDLHSRTPAEGDDTDHVAALNQALDLVGSGGPQRRVVFLLTDGKLNVANSPSWGDRADRRNGAAEAELPRVLDKLAAAGIQVWPLGFGKVDKAALSGFAKGKSCTPSVADPREQIIPNSSELTAAVIAALSAASCVKPGPFDTGTVPEGGSTDLTVNIPAVATDASIVVYKHDPRVQVEYRAPHATRAAPAEGGKHFEFGGQSTETESVNITDPEPGEWTIHLSSAGLPAQEVAATVVYQAAVKAYLVANPPQPAAGQAVDLTMQVWARGHVLTDEDSLQGLTFTADVTGTAGFPEQKLKLEDADRHGTFSGRFTVPAGASGPITVSGQVSGVGIGGDTRVLSTTVAQAAPAVQAQVLFDDTWPQVTPGQTVSGTLSVTNNSGRPVPLRVELADVTPGAAVTVEPPTVTAGAGTSQTPFTLKFGARTPLGGTSATVRLVDDGTPPRVVGQRLLATDVEPEPGLLEKLFWVWVGAGVLAAVALAFLFRRWRTRRDKEKLRGLKLQLLQGGGVVAELTPPDPDARLLDFAVHEDFSGPQLHPAAPGQANGFRIRRARGAFEITPSGGTPVSLALGEPHEISGDRAIAVADTAKAGTATPDPLGQRFDPFDDAAATGAFADPFSGGFANGAPDPAPDAAAAFDPFAGAYSPQEGNHQDPEPFEDGPPGGARPSSGTARPRPSHHDPGPPDDAYFDPGNPFR